MPRKGLLLRLLSLILLVSYYEPVKGQEVDYQKIDYSAIDNYVHTLKGKKFKTTGVLALQLTQPFEQEHEKLRALFIWITDNITYDWEAYFDPKKRETDPQKLLKSRKAICGGYASLLEAMCHTVGIQCQVISGYSRTEPKQIAARLNKLVHGHAWNAVMLNKQWYLIDATWAAGAMFESIRLYNEHYYLTPPEQFILNHLPEKDMWQLLSTPVTRQQFEQFPYIGEGTFQNKITDFMPRQGVIQAKTGTTVTFGFKTMADKKIKTITVTSDKPLASMETVKPLVDENGFYTCTYPLTLKGNYLITIQLNHFNSFTYRIIANE